VTRVGQVKSTQVIRLLNSICGALPGTVPAPFRIMVHALYDHYRPGKRDL